jgi:hypothetical protein
VEPLAVELGPAQAPSAVVLFGTGMVPQLLPSRYSPGYGQVRAARKVEVRVQVSAPACLRWVVLFQ